MTRPAGRAPFRPDWATRSSAEPNHAERPLQKQYFVDYGLAMSGSVLATIPLLILFIFVGRRMVSGVMDGAFKGWQLPDSALIFLGTTCLRKKAMTIPMFGSLSSPAISPRVLGLINEMTLDEKLAQLVGIRVGAGEGGEIVAPLQDQQSGGSVPFEEFARNGLGQLTRVFGTAPVSPAAGRQALRRTQRWLTRNTRLGIPALAHEECLTGFAAWGATTFPTPIAWGQPFTPS